MDKEAYHRRAVMPSETAEFVKEAFTSFPWTIHVNPNVPKDEIWVIDPDRLRDAVHRVKVTPPPE